MFYVNKVACVTLKEFWLHSWNMTLKYLNDIWLDLALKFSFLENIQLFLASSLLVLFYQYLCSHWKSGGKLVYSIFLGIVFNAIGAKYFG